MNTIGKLKMYMGLARATLRSDIANLALRIAAPGARKETVRSAGPADYIADLCTGTGSVLIEYARRNPNSRIFAFDRDPGTLALVQRRLENAGLGNVETIAAEVDNGPVEAGSFGLVNISFGLHENDSQSRASILAECRRLLGGGGRLVITDYREVKGVLKGMLMRLYLRVFEPEWIGELFDGGLVREVESAGFEIETVRTDIPMTQLIIAKIPESRS